MNPIFPHNDYIPDGEPRIFGDRVYIYGSHDKFNSKIFCVGDYVTYSAPLNDLNNWRNEGVIFRAKQDPLNKKGKKLLFAPDVVQGEDGMYYMLYGLDFFGTMGVARSSSPKGPFDFIGHIKHKNGKLWGRVNGDPMPFDPAIWVENGHIYVFSGFAIGIPFIMTGWKQCRNDGGVILELENDWVTIKEEPKLLFPKKGRKGCFPNHAFFEASSIRKFNGKYYFIYSSEWNHELCYATSDKIDGPYTFKSTLVDIGDVFIDGKTEKEAINYMGNTHGGMFEHNGAYYLMYHRHTNRHGYSRQLCTERFEMDENGDFRQHEITSLGFHDGPFEELGEYKAFSACILYSEKGAGRYDINFAKQIYKNQPAFTQDENEVGYIDGLRNGSVFGYRYFKSSALKTISLKIKGKAKGILSVYSDEKFSEKIGEINIDIATDKWTDTPDVNLTCKESDRVSLVFKYTGEGKLDVLSAELK